MATLKQFLNAGGILPQNNVAARQAAISAAHPRLSNQQVTTRANRQVFQSFQKAGQLNQFLPQNTVPNNSGAIGTTQYTQPSYTNNGPTNPQLQSDTGSLNTSPLSVPPDVGAIAPGSSSTPSGVLGFFSALSSTQQTLLIVGIVGIGAFLLYREFRK
jgi:hypothetical protein